MRLSLPRTMKPSLPRTMKPSLPRTMKPSLPRTIQPSLWRTMKPSLLRTMKPSLLRTMKPSLLRRNRLPAVMVISNFQNCSTKYLRVFREHFINLFFFVKGDNQQETIPAENNETIFVEKEPLTSNHGYFQF